MFDNKAQVIKSILFLLPFVLFYLTMTIIDVFMIDEPTASVNYFLLFSIVGLFAFLLMIESWLAEASSEISKMKWFEQKLQTLRSIYRAMIGITVFIAILYYHFIMIIGRMFR